MTYTEDELDCDADALRRFEQGGKNLGTVLNERT